MAKSRSRSRGTRKKSSIKRKGSRTRKSVTVPVKKYVQKAIHAQIENKAIQYNGGFTLQNYADLPQMNAFALSPGLSIPIPQGVGAADRSGNRIKIQKAKLVYWMVPSAYNALLNPTPKPLLVRMWIGYSKTSPTLIPLAVDMALLFQNGNASAPPNNFINDYLRTVNRDKFVIFRDIKHKLGYEAATGSGAVAGSQYFGNNDFHYNISRTVDITKYLINNVIYNDATSTPTTRGLFCWIQVINADNTVTTGTIPASFNYFIDLVFEDA